MILALVSELFELSHRYFAKREPGLRLCTRSGHQRRGSQWPWQAQSVSLHRPTPEDLQDRCPYFGLGLAIAHDWTHWLLRDHALPGRHRRPRETVRRFASISRYTTSVTMP